MNLVDVPGTEISGKHNSGKCTFYVPETSGKHNSGKCTFSGQKQQTYIYIYIYIYNII